MAAPFRNFGRHEAWTEGYPNETTQHIDGFDQTTLGGDDYTIFERRSITQKPTLRNAPTPKMPALTSSSSTLVSPPMGGPIGGVTPAIAEMVLAREKPAVWVAFDTEWCGGEAVPKRWDGQRRIVSWQFAFLSGSELVEWLVVPRTTRPFPLELMCRLVADELGAPRYLYREYATKSRGWRDAPSFRIVLMCHAALGDVSSMGGSKRLLQTLGEAGAGLISTYPYPLHTRADKSRNYFYRLSLSVCDTMCYSDHASLAAIGDSLGFPKLPMSEQDYTNMAQVLVDEPERYAEYAMRDCLIVHRYMSEFCQTSDVSLPPTAPAFSARFTREYLTELYYEGDGSNFDAGFRGVVRRDAGLEPVDDGQSFVMTEKMEPVSPYARELCTFAADAYRGGINASFICGYISGVTFDHDLIGAYPLGMSAGFDPDYSQPFVRSFLDEDITLQKLGDMRIAPFLPGFGYVHFEFPADTYLPCIGIKTEHGIVFPLTSRGTSGVPATMAEVVMALRMGATVHAERFDIAAIFERESVLLAANKALISERAQAKQAFGKGSPQEIAAKLLGNANYGKVGQAVDPKQRRNLWTLEVMDVERSGISSPVHAAMGTAIVRCIIVAAVNELTGRGYRVYSATTDGFITDAPLDVVESLPLRGMRDRLEDVRLKLTDGASSVLFAEKHRNEGLLNFTTRGNVAVNEGGVLARNGLKGYIDGTAEERAELIERIVTRTGPLHYATNQWISPADMIRHDEDFHTYPVVKTSNPNFDLKRCPDLNSLQTVDFVIGSTPLTTPTFDTRPYATLEEFFTHKSAVKGHQLVREDDYRALHVRASSPTTKASSSRDLVRFAVTAHRAGHVTIPALTVLSGVERLQWINQFISDGRAFSASDWKNAGRAERKATLPEPNVYADMVFEMSVTPC